MPDHGYPPVPPTGIPPQQQPPVGYQAPAGPPPYGSPYGPQPPYQQPPRRSRAWLWWTLGILLALALLIGSCTLPFALLLGSDKAGVNMGGGDAVAVIRLDGVISGTGDTYSGTVTPESFLDQLDQAAEDDRVKAVLLRVDSPGGTVAASEEISDYVKTMKKPVVVSVGDVGASGAYMVSSQADEIWANPGSAVGSIGVISEIPNVNGLLDKVGVEFQVITAGKNKDTGSPYRPLTKEERALIQGEVNEAYGQFIDIVASGRKMERSEVESLATGWAWSGDQAKELGLVDKIGTYRDALDAAADRGGIKGDYDVVTYDDEFDQLFGSLLGVTKAFNLFAQNQIGREAAVRSSLPR